MIRRIYAIVMLTCCCASCTTLPEANDCCVTATISDRLGKEVYWTDESAADSIACAIQELLQDDLTVDSAVQIALLNNRDIQAVFEEIGIAEADLVEAGLLSNPIFSAIVRYPDRSGFMTNPEFSIAQSFIDILLMPLRKKVAAAEFERVKFKIASAVLEIAFDVEEVYYELAAAQKKSLILKNIIELAELGNQIAVAERQVGNVNPLMLQLRTADYFARTVEAAEAEAEVIHYRERLNRLLGLTAPNLCWNVPSVLPYIPDCEPSPECLEQLALRERPEIQAAMWEVERYRRVFPTVQWWAFTNLYVGVSSTREPDIGSPWTTGPSVAGEIPIFNFGQASRKRLWAQCRQACHRLAALEVTVQAEVREARDQLIVFRNQVINYSNNLIPNQELILNSTGEMYNAMAVGIDELLDAKRNQVTAYLHYQLALKEYWTKKVGLDRAVGGKLYLLQAEESP